MDTATYRFRCLMDIAPRVIRRRISIIPASLSDTASVVMVSVVTTDSKKAPFVTTVDQRFDLTTDTT